ncbi:hypothetical protein JB92DRAFT_2834855 [Gautieria morchelliformis]|nr:hypothetical protein JB92DRAFT_2834855 [Gautieria morchelliformis]
MQVFLKKKALEWREEQKTSPRTSTCAIVQDANHALERISDELQALNARTGVEAFLFAVKGKPEHPMPGFYVSSAKAGWYLLHGMKKHTSDITKEFEAYVLADIEGLAMNHNARLTELKCKIRIKIREGLGDPKAIMHFNCYEKMIVVQHGVKLKNWPPDVPFVNASEIGSLHAPRRLFAALTSDDDEQRCQWVNLSQENWDQQKATWEAGELKAVPCKCKRKATVAEQDSASDEAESDEEEEAPPKKKAASGTRTNEKENAGVTGSGSNDAVIEDGGTLETTGVDVATKKKPVAKKRPTAKKAASNLKGPEKNGVNGRKKASKKAPALSNSSNA